LRENAIIFLLTWIIAMKHARTLLELFSFNGFVAKNQLDGKFGDPKVRTIVLERKKKQQDVPCAGLTTAVITIKKYVSRVTAMLKAIEYIFASKDVEFLAENVVVSLWRL
jgi:hypothetical protein